MVGGGREPRARHTTDASSSAATATSSRDSSDAPDASAAPEGAPEGSPEGAAGVAPGAAGVGPRVDEMVTELGGTVEDGRNEVSEAGNNPIPSIVECNKRYGLLCTNKNLILT